jgi:T4 RnlA family RNA ligase
MNIKYEDMVKLVNKREEVRVKSETIGDEEFQIFCYMVASPDLWAEYGALEARGITFDANGVVRSRTMEKFFNINENQYTQLDKLDFTNAIVYDKLDGSMITPVMLSDGSVRVKTKKSFYSDVALDAQKYIEANKNVYDMMRYTLLNGYTPSFEYTNQKHQIVVDYGPKENMTLLMVRNTVTGEEVEYNEVLKLGEMYGIDVVKAEKITSIDYYIDLAKSITGIEGWAFHLPKSNIRVKLKTQWYLARHRLTSYNTRDIFDLIINEEIDDLIPELELKPGAMDKVNTVAHKIAHLFKETEDNAKKLADSWACMELRDIGKLYKDHTYFGLAIKLYKGQEPDYKKFIINTYRNDFDTNPIFWGFNAGDE